MGRPAKLVLQAAAVAVVVLLVALLGWQVATKEKGRSIARAFAAGETPLAPDFTLPRLDGDGTITLSSLRGKVVVLNFWGSWCYPCRTEAPLLEAAWQRYKARGVVFLGVDFWDFRSDARRFIDRYHLTYPNVRDGPGSVLGRYGVVGAPETFFVSRDGRLVGEHILGPVTAEKLDRNIELALEAQP